MDNNYFPINRIIDTSTNKFTFLKGLSTIESRLVRKMFLQLRDIRFRDPKNLDCSRLVKYDGKNCIVGFYNTASRRFFKNSLYSIRQDPSVKLSSLKKIVICIKTIPKRPKDLVHYFSFNWNYKMYDGTKLLHNGSNWKCLLRYNRKMALWEATKLQSAAIAK